MEHVWEKHLQRHQQQQEQELSRTVTIAATNHQNKPRQWLLNKQ